MSAPITESHKALWTKLYNLAFDEIFHDYNQSSDGPAHQLIADSEAAAVQTAMLREYGNLCATNESLAKERDQLRAEVERLKHGTVAQFKDAFIDELKREVSLLIARADRAEAELGKLEELHGCSQGMVVHWCAHAAERSQGLDQARAELATWHSLRLWGTTPEIVHDFIKGQQARIHAAQDAEAELATEREKLSTLREACGHISYLPRIQSALDKTAPAPGALT
jgi:hypothetical protein